MSSPLPSLPARSAQILAYVHAELAALEIRADAAAHPRHSRRKLIGPSVVFSVRLDPADVRELEARAEAAGIRPTALARNLIRCGLTNRFSADVPSAVDRVQGALDELRSILR